ncbi:threonine synthase [Clostridia bacterium]|nr:threonine synthase [Clostridia bacterium]
MIFVSTRNASEKAEPSEALLRGLAEDGGLYVPESFPDCTDCIDISLDYKILAARILSRYFTDFTFEEISECTSSAYDEKFDTPEIAPIHTLDDAHFLELYHGRTLAFKDMALSILPHLLSVAARKRCSKKLLILTATSGDTGKAALEAFADAKDTAIVVFYPSQGVSAVQKYQMITQTGDNVLVVGINGNFDDTQNGVKAIFADKEIAEEIDAASYSFSSANSINIGRLLPQTAYYFHAYNTLLKENKIKKGEEINFAVPTGNFGNILAGYYAKKMGLPIRKLICASNSNKVLFDFFSNNEYDINRGFFCTISPSMDILISSNFERLLYEQSDAETVSSLMESLKNSKRFSFTNKLDCFTAGYANEQETMDAIKSAADKGYLIDTHTAVAFSVYKKYKHASGDLTKTVILSTANPFKFAADVCRSIQKDYAPETDFDALDHLSKLSKTEIPPQIRGIDKRPVRHPKIAESADMPEIVKSFLKRRCL